MGFHLIMPVTIASIFLLAMSAMPAPPSWVLASSEEVALTEEASSLAAELVEIKARLERALGDRESIVEEIRGIEEERSRVEKEIVELEVDIETKKAILGQTVRNLYMQGDMDILEVILEARDLDSLWRDTYAYRRVYRAGERAVRELQSKTDDLVRRRADLRGLLQKKQELLGTLHVEGLESRKRRIEERLTQINIKLREIRASRSPRNVPPLEITPFSGRLCQRIPDMPPLSSFQRTGIVYSGYTSWYGADFHGKPTASGIPFNMYDFTCAHPFLPLGTWLLVTLNGRQAVVQVNDRGPFIPGRVLDLSWRAAREIGLGGVARTTFEVLLPVSGEFLR